MARTDTASEQPIATTDPLPLPGEVAVHASNGPRQHLGDLSQRISSHGVWSEFSCFVPTRDGVAAGLLGMKAGGMVATEELGTGVTGRLFSFFVGKSSPCYAAVLTACTASIPKLNLVQLMGRGNCDCRVFPRSEESPSAIPYLASYEVLELHRKLCESLKCLSVKAVKQTRSYAYCGSFEAQAVEGTRAGHAE